MDQVRFLKGFFNKFYLVHSWIFCPTCSSQQQPSLYLLLTSTLRLAALLLADIFQLRDEHWCSLSCFCGKVIFDPIYNCFYNLMITEGYGYFLFSEFVNFFCKYSWLTFIVHNAELSSNYETTCPWPTVSLVRKCY